MNNLFFIQPIGTHCTGKSRVLSSIALSYGVEFTNSLTSYTKDDTCIVLGKYTNRKNKNYTGGFDAFSVTAEERRKAIKKVWESNYKIVMVEGFMLSYYNQFLSWYKTLKPSRKVIIIYLNPSLEVIKERLQKRSGGKEWSKKRENHVLGKAKVCSISFNKIIDDDFFIKREFKNESENGIFEILKYVEEQTNIKMKEYLHNRKILVTLDNF